MNNELDPTKRLLDHHAFLTTSDTPSAMGSTMASNWTHVLKSFPECRKDGFEGFVDYREIYENKAGTEEHLGALYLANHRSMAYYMMMASREFVDYPEVQEHIDCCYHFHLAWYRRLSDLLNPSFERNHLWLN